MLSLRVSDTGGARWQALGMELGADGVNDTISVAAVLDAYEGARREVVVATARLIRACRKLRRRIGLVDAADRKAVTAAVDSYVAARYAEGVGDGTVRRELVVLRAAMMMAWKQGELRDRPYIGLPPAPPGRQRWLTSEEAAALLDAAAPRARLLILLALMTGARLGALLELTWDRVDLRRCVIDFRAPHPRAQRRKRRAVVPIAEPLLDLLAAAKRQDESGGRVVRLGEWTAERLVRDAGERAGLGRVTPHVLRHTAATWMLGNSVDLVGASRMLGHSSTLITEQIYAHLVVEALRPAAETLGRLCPALPSAAPIDKMPFNPG